MCTNPDSSDGTAVSLCAEGLRYYGALLRGADSAAGCPPCLLEFGLVARLADGTLTPLSPHAALGPRLGGLEQTVEEGKRALDAMRTATLTAESVYRDNHSPAGLYLVRPLVGAEAISAALSATVSACRSELLTAQPGGGRPAELLAKALDTDLPALARGVRQRTIYQHTVRTHTPTLAYAERIVAAGGQIRTIDEVFNRLIICDRRIAFVPDPGAERGEYALAIEHPGVVRYLIGIFEHAWNRAVALDIDPCIVSPTTPAVTDEVRRAVLRLMINGHTDSAIATRLGMSVRSVTNHVRWATDLFESRSRAQLAYLLASTDFLNEE